MKKTIGILLAVLLCMIPLAALAEGEGETEPTEAPEQTSEPAQEPVETAAPTEEPADAVEITPAGDSDTYKEWLMDSFDQTLLGKNENLRRQLLHVLRSDEIVVTADNYKNILRYVNETVSVQRLSENAELDHYTDEDFAIAAELIEKIANELGLEYSIDPSNDSQNEYARVITIKKDGKLIGRINSDAKTDVGDAPSLGWIIGGGVLIGAAAVFAVVLVIFVERKKKKAVSNGSK
ncbi:MAG: hypothetical protein IKP38_05305 [Clostridia bacterium]|nr:hypothetical protein [Clostridia bacterium]